MKIFIGADHQGYHLKERLEVLLRELGYDVHDEGNESLQSEDDFPVFASRVVHAMKEHGSESRGILICGSGQGMAIAANRHKGIRAVVAWNKTEAKLARNDDDSNVLALPAHLLKSKDAEAFEIVESWLRTPYERIAKRDRRIRELDEL